jgi:fibronectin type III domain protein
MAAQAPPRQSRPWHRLGVAALAAVAGLVLLGAAPVSTVLTSSGARSRPGPTLAARTGSGVPELLKPAVTHEPDAYELLGVSCSSVKYCVAVGYGAGSSFAGGVAVPIQNGVPGKPILSKNSASVFHAVACVSATECIIAGSEPVSGQTAAQAVVWLLQGAKLSLLRQSTATHNLSADFTGATCRARTCEVVGNATYLTSAKAQAPIAVFGGIALRASPAADAVDVVDNDALGYASSVSCPAGPVCYVGGATAAGAGAEAYLSLSSGVIKGPFTQPGISGIDALTCPSFTSCGAAEVENLTFPQTAGFVEKLNQRSSGTPAMVAGSQLMLGIAEVNQLYYLAVGAENGGSWLTDLVTAAGKPRPPAGPGNGGYLQAVSCPVQTDCIAVGFTSDPNPHQPGGQSGVDGAIVRFPLRTAPSAPRLKVTGTGHTSVKLRITPPGSDGGARITGYGLAVTRCQPHHRPCRQKAVKTLTVSARTRTVTVPGLASKTTYYFEVRATNAIGTGPYSAKVRATT